MASNIYISSTNLVIVENIYDELDLLTDAEVLAATGTVTLYSDASHSSAVSGASSLTLNAFAGQTVAPGRFYASIPHTVTLVEGTLYYAEAVLQAVDVSASVTVQLKLEEECTAQWKS